MSDSHMPYGSPRRVPLQDVAKVIMGQSPPSAAYNTDGDGLSFFQGKAEFGPVHPTPVKWCSAPTKVAEPDDVLMSVRAPVGPTNLATERCCIGRGLAAIRAAPGVRSKWLLYAFRAMERAIDDLGTGTTFKAISGETLRRLEVPIAALDHQDRVIEEIETQFSRLDEAVANLKRVRLNLRRYERTVLEAAARGFARSGRSVTLGEVAFVTKLAGFEYTKFVRYDPAGDLAVIKAENAGRDGFKATSFSRLRSETVAALTRSRLKAGDLFMVFVGAGTGRVARVPGDQPYFLGPNVALIRPATSDVAPEFLEYYLRSPTGLRAALSFSKAVAQPSLSMGTIRAIPILLPPIDQQRCTVAELDRRLSIVREVEAEVDANLKRANLLRQAVLAHAFG